MAEELGSEVTFSAIWDSVNTLGFWTGVCLVCALAVVILLLVLWSCLKRRSRYLVISVQDGSEFRISLRAVRTHLASYVLRAYPRLVLQRVTLHSCRGGLRAEVDVMARCGENMQVLSNTVMKDLQNSLNETMGLGELFTRVDVVITSLEEAGGTVSEPSATPARTDAPEPSATPARTDAPEPSATPARTDAPELADMDPLPILTKDEPVERPSAD